MSGGVIGLEAGIFGEEILQRNKNKQYQNDSAHEHTHTHMHKHKSKKKEHTNGEITTSQAHTQDERQHQVIPRTEHILNTISHALVWRTTRNDLTVIAAYGLDFQGLPTKEKTTIKN